MAPPEPRTGFLTGRRGPRTTALILTTGAIGSALAALLVASGVLTPTGPGLPLFGPPPAPPAPATSAPETPAPASGPPSPGTPTPGTPAPTPSAAPSPPPASVPPSPTPASRQSRAADSGVLRQGDSGPGVEELQERLRRVPDIYPDGDVDGRYDAEVAAAVARFQQWYGVRGDEEGVYGDDTRRDLEART
ncbi:peptidoglycan-binding protein [Streptomyces sp. DH37]|uniref:peptidoglycan-binding domain-containing protein n=1 Tax=Streptomyces sp. DH37 TaxID=3040122 RepID=UPI002441543C|nr:peptidoglycan-binding domain-containing protein [Streptomyces sp. DH37]MDG9703932.1 peptidoglycan-binding domain-containing protein [Streptomyces sp. DH37]